jgi:septum formation protein
MLVSKKLILASGSPRRQHLLRQIGLTFEVRESGIDEDEYSGSDPGQHVVTLSRLKASSVGASCDNAIIIGADTIVVVDGVILGKPVDEADAARMLRVLSDRSHDVYTGFTLLDRPSNKMLTQVELTRVTFRRLEEEEIQEYVSSRAPMDKAGAYGIQDDKGAVFVARVEGCFYNVVGLPLTKVYLALREIQREVGLTG